ncbi:unnamed protein product [Didymodactylos carnosus]|uniref:Fatty acid desaturase domain-containing protein n=1 Tax=Didymodactylos carnosus TaxID=1234261 RepID=A0A814MWP4_9BILA|nr:unnamed protein product [Didymodactylos carnosus]CAF1085131.1 unnamed protein product [Didymodactylos carnosus]CAF3679949.1 unnamed protein product [Didymodactylos carnosus]CAF3850754.1 unnamed protein product [Didymodactylos carnosus]
MGKGKHNPSILSPSDDSVHVNKENYINNGSIKLHPLPTLTEIKSKIPSHCFRPTVMRSMFYVFIDAVYILLTYLTMFYIQKYFTYGYLIFPLYWYAQGTLYTSLFVLGHDCGHGSFSSHQWIDDIMGTILHTYVLVPYYPWKVSHNNHHKNTGNIDKDEVFYPRRLKAVDDELSKNMDKIGERRRSFQAPYFGLGIGWFYYLVFGYAPRPVNHFNPFHPMFQKHIVGVTSSLIAYSLMFYLMHLYAQSYGYFALISYHLIPTFIFACYIVIITFLQHTEVDVPWYSGDEWNYVRGQLSTIDRNYGHVHSIIHSAGTHQIHHLFTKVPHYHSEEATKYFRKAFPHLVRLNHERILPSFIRMFKIHVKQRSLKNDVRIFQYNDEKIKST